MNSNSSSFKHLPGAVAARRAGKWRYLPSDGLLDAAPAEVINRVMNGLFPSSAGELAAQPDQMLFDPEDLARNAARCLPPPCGR